MQEKVTIFWVWNVHAETIAVAIAEPDGEVRSLGTIPNRAESIRKLTNKLAQQRSCEPVMRPDRRATYPFLVDHECFELFCYQFPHTGSIDFNGRIPVANASVCRPDSK
jgi:hypothetical protein